MRGASLVGPVGSAEQPVLSGGQRDAAVLAALERLVPAPQNDDLASVAVDDELVTAWRRFPAIAAKYAD